MFEWQEQYLTSELRSVVKYCSCRSNVKFISSRYRVISSIERYLAVNKTSLTALVIISADSTTRAKRAKRGGVFPSPDHSRLSSPACFLRWDTPLYGLYRYVRSPHAI